RRENRDLRRWRMADGGWRFTKRLLVRGCRLPSAIRHLIRRLPRLRREKGLDESVEIAVEDARRIANFVSRPQILHELIRLQHVRADLAAEADVFLLPFDLGLLFLALVQLQLIQPRAKEAHGDVAVLV